MTAPTLSLNPTTSDPSLADLLQLVKKDVFLNLNCHHIGTVRSFNAETQQASVTINYQKTFFQLNAATGVYTPVLISYPPLTDCPVFVLSGGAGALTLPIAAGDQCLVAFNDRDMDNWFAGSSNGAVASARLHAFSDAVIFVGLHPQDSPIEDYDTERVVLRNGTALVGVGASLVKIANGVTTLNTLLQSMITNLQNLTSAVAGITTIDCVVGSPVTLNPASIAAVDAVSSALTTLGDQIGELLE